MLFADCVSLSYHRICPLPLFIFVNNNTSNNNTHVSNFLRRNININNDPVICSDTVSKRRPLFLATIPTRRCAWQLKVELTLLYFVTTTTEESCSKLMFVDYEYTPFLHQSENRIRPRSDSLYIIIITPNVNKIIPL